MVTLWTPKSSHGSNSIAQEEKKKAADNPTGKKPVEVDHEPKKQLRTQGDSEKDVDHRR